METTSHTKSTWKLEMLAPLEPGIVCKDIDRMIAFYVDVIGLKLVSDAETPKDLSEQFGATPHGYRIVRMQTPYGERIKLVQPNKEAPIPEPHPMWIYNRHGLSYLTFVVPNIKDAVEHLVICNVKLASQDIVEVRPGIYAIYFLDPEDNYLEFVEVPDIASYRPDLYQ